jgi:putative addiction module CopG family antidote
MRSTKQLSITLPNEMADLIKEKVAAGEYVSESEVIRDGIRALLSRERTVYGWLYDQVGSAYGALKDNPDRAITARQ